MSKNILRIVVLIGFGLLQLSLLPSCTVNRGGVIIGSPAPPPPARKSGPPPWAPAHGHRAKYKYRYYPCCYVYHDIGRGVYFYLEGNRWRMSARLPSGIHIRYSDYVTIELETDKPYEYFSEHRKKYPPGLAKKNKKHKWK